MEATAMADVTEIDLTPEEIAEARRIFEGKADGKSGCWHCGGLHDPVVGLPAQRQPCPRVKRAVWHADGTLLEVEYWASGEWEDDYTVYPRDVFGVDVPEDNAGQEA